MGGSSSPWVGRVKPSCRICCRDSTPPQQAQLCQICCQESRLRRLKALFPMCCRVLAPECLQAIPFQTGCPDSPQRRAASLYRIYYLRRAEQGTTREPSAVMESLVEMQQPDRTSG